MPTRYEAKTTTGTFRQSCSIRCDIHAPAETVWALLTDAPGFARWNSTITSLEGQIALGHKLAIKVPLDPKRTFTPKVSATHASIARAREDFLALMAHVRPELVLPVAQRSAVILEDVLGHSLDETAQIIYTTVLAIKALLVRGRAKLQTDAPTKADDRPIDRATFATSITSPPRPT